MLKSKYFEIFNLSFSESMKEIWKDCQNAEEQKFRDADFELVGAHE